MSTTSVGAVIGPRPSGRKTIILRFARGAGYAALAGAVSFAAAHYTDLNTMYPAILTPFIGGVLQALDKWLRDGGDTRS